MKRRIITIASAVAVVLGGLTSAGEQATARVAAMEGVSVRVPNAASGATVVPGGTIKLIGVSWKGDPDIHAEVRIRGHEGWSGWKELEPASAEGPDGAADGAARSSELLWLGSASAVQLRMPHEARDVHLNVVREKGWMNTPAPVSAQAAPTQPSMTMRASWGARPPVDPPSYASSLKMAFVHHTAGSNDYSPSESAGIVRAIQAYHMDVNGWNDIGYNFLVDRFGQIFEGRGGGVERPVIGAHAAGFNTGSTGVSVLGDFTNVAPTGEALHSVISVLAWKLAIHAVDPSGTTLMTSGGGSTTRYPSGTQVALSNISGHRDTGITSCPGGHLYSRLDTIRIEATRRAAAFVPYPGFPGGIFVAGGDLDSSGDAELVTGPDSGGGPHVRTFSSAGTAGSSFFAYDGAFTGGVRVAVASFPLKVTPASIVTAPGPGGGPDVRLFSPQGVQQGGFYAYDSRFAGGIYLATGNVDGVSGDEVITAPGPGGGPHVRVFRRDGMEVSGFYAYDSRFPGGVRVAAADFDGDGSSEVVTAPGPGGGPHVRIWKLNGSRWDVLAEFFAYDAGFSGGVYVATGVTPDGRPVVITGAGEGGGPHVKVLTMTGGVVHSYFLLDSRLINGVRVGGAGFDAGEGSELAMAGGPRSFPLVRLGRLDSSLLRVGP